MMEQDAVAQIEHGRAVNPNCHNYQELEAERKIGV